MTKKQIAFRWTEPIISICMILFVSLSVAGLYGTHQIEKQLEHSQSQLELANRELELAKEELIDLKIISGWGAGSATVNTAVLTKYQNEYNLMLIFLLEIRSVDYLTDTHIVKSYPFDIYGKTRTVEVPPHDNEFWSRLPSSTGRVKIYPVLLPKSIPVDRIKCLADVKVNQGRIFNPKGVLAALLIRITTKKVDDAHKIEIPQAP